jgi:hypothetical protein
LLWKIYDEEPGQDGADVVYGNSRSLRHELLFHSRPFETGGSSLNRSTFDERAKNAFSGTNRTRHEDEYEEFRRAAVAKEPNGSTSMTYKYTSRTADEPAYPHIIASGVYCCDENGDMSKAK